MRDVEVATRAYRRRILLLGVVLAAVLAAAGVPWYLRAVESDLERRVPAHLADHVADLDADDVAASFTGQDGTLRCRSPLLDPEAVLDAAHDVRGVRAVRLDRSCRVSSAPTIATTVPEPLGTDPAVTADTRPGDDADPPAFDSIADLVGSDPQFSLLAALAAESDSAHLFTDAGPITVFAPSDAAFEDLPADVLAELRQRPDVLAEVIRHHVVSGGLAAADLVTGELDALDGTPLDVVADGRVVGDPPVLLGTFRVGDASLVTVDLTARNGVVHVIDRVLLPDGVELDALAPRPDVLVAFSDGRASLSGTVSSGAARSLLLDALGQVLDSANVTDDLDDDESADVGPAEVVPMAAVIPAAMIELASGSVGLVNGEVVVSGFAVGEAARDRLLDVITAEGAIGDVEVRPPATQDDVAALDAELAAVLAEQPLQFAPGGAELDAAAGPTLDRLAGLVKRYEGVVVEIGGYTDTAGSAAVNQVLSEERAGAVLFQLVARGVPFEQLTAVGYGATSPIVIDGVEDPEASRRVELVPELAVPPEAGQP